MLKKHRHLRLKALRKIIGLTQQRLADRCGKSCAYIVAVETGRLGMSSSLAEAISYATGIAPGWLLGQGKISEPVNVINMPYSREYFFFAFERRGGPLSELDPDGDESSEIHSRCHQLTRLMRAAYRKRRFPLALYLFRKMVNDMKAKLLLADGAGDDSERSLQKLLFGPVPNAVQDEFEVDILARLMSPTAFAKWAAALNGDQDSRNGFLRDLYSLQDLVKGSFDMRAATVQWSKKESAQSENRGRMR
jgi:transcriptional regulator with XRE-family HTH domain